MAYDRYDEGDGIRERVRDRDGRDRSRGERGFFRDDHQEGERHGRQEHRRGHRHDGVATDETRDLIAANKVEGTPVYGRDDQRLGTIKTLMIDKYRGQVRYAVLAHASGFLGLDERFLPVQWDELRYDDRRGGYRVDFTNEDVRYTLDRRERERTRGERDWVDRR